MAFTRAVNTRLRETKAKLDDISYQEKRRIELNANRTANRHRWVGRVDQGDRENLF